MRDETDMDGTPCQLMPVDPNQVCVRNLIN